jgi:type IV secretory pathway TrbD component
MARALLTKLFAYYIFGWVLGMVLILVLKMWLDSTHGFCILLTCYFGFTYMSRDPSENLGGI